jgi:hypothetical protein
MRSTFTSSHTLWATYKTFLAQMTSGTCYTTVEKARLLGIYNGWKTGHGFSSGSYITTQDRDYLINAMYTMFTKRNN